MKNWLDIKTKFGKAILLGIGLVVLFSYMDSLGFSMFQSIGGFNSDTYVRMEPAYMKFFWTFAYSSIVLLGICYWNFVKKDKSEVVAVILTPLILLFGGLEDLMYYFFTGIPFFGTTLPWLDDNFFMGYVAKWLGFSNVTSTSLLISIALGIVVLYFTLGKLKRARW